MEDERGLPVPRPTAPPKVPEAGGVCIQRRMLVWDADGMPVPANVPALTRPQIENLAGAALSLPYEPVPPEEPDYSVYTTEASKEVARVRYEKDYERWQAEGKKYAGMSCAEVMMIKRAQAAASGDPEAMDALLDRSIGKPKQTSESLVKTMKYEDFLKKMAEDEARRAAQGGAVDAEVVPPPPPPAPAPPAPEEFPGLSNLL